MFGVGPRCFAQRLLWRLFVCVQSREESEVVWRIVGREMRWGGWSLLSRLAGRRERPMRERSWLGGCCAVPVIWISFAESRWRCCEKRHAEAAARAGAGQADPQHTPWSSRAANENATSLSPPLSLLSSLHFTSRPEPHNPHLACDSRSLCMWKGTIQSSRH